MSVPRIIPDRGEFIDALRLLLNGHVLVNVGGISDAFVINGHPLYSVQRTLIDYGLVQEFDNPDGFDNVRYFRLSQRGREFAERACEQWRRQPLLQRLIARFTG
jgi:hypothetical protein